MMIGLTSSVLELLIPHILEYAAMLLMPALKFADHYSSLVQARPA